MTEEKKRKSAAPAARRASASAKSGAQTKQASAKTSESAAKKKAPTAKPAKGKTASTAKSKAAKTTAKTVIEIVEERAPQERETKRKNPAAKARKAKAKAAAGSPGDGTQRPVLDPVGDTTDGEGRAYTGDAESLAIAEMDAFRADTNLAAMDSGLEAGRGFEAVQIATEERARTAAQDAARAAPDSARATDESEADAEAREPAKLERLQKILSKAGVASRRRAEEMIVAGRVMVNGQAVTALGSKADPARDHIRVDGKLLHGAERHRYFLLNKPKGYVTTVSDPEGRSTVMQFFAKMPERLYPVGRLDYQSEGLLLMTNDGELANLLTKAGSGVEKTYLVKVAGQPSEEELDRLRGGVAIEKGEVGSERVHTSPARIHQVRHGDNPWYEVVLTEGRNRELRKMFAAIGHFAEKIRRVGYGPLVLDVEPGKMRELSEDEVNALRLTAEGRIKPRRVKLDRVLPKEAGIAAEKRGDRGARPWRDKPAGKQFDGPRGGAPGGGRKPSGQREERGPRTEWKPRERTFGGGSAAGAERSGERGGERPRFDKRSSGPPRAGSGFGARPSRPFAAKPGFGGGRGAGRSAERGAERPRFDKRSSGPPRAGSGFGARPSRPFAAKPGFGGGRVGGPGRSGERKEWKPRGQDFGAKPGDRTAGRFENAPRKPFRAQGAFVRPEGSFKRSDGPKKPFDGGRGAGPGAGKSFGRRTGSKERWVPRPGRARNEEGRAETGSGERPAPAFGGERGKGFGAGEGAGRPKPGFGARTGGFKRPGKPGGFSRPGGFSKTGRPGGGNRGGSRFGGKRPGGR
jgi:23S rRNA pseudouridine2605 synthase